MNTNEKISNWEVTILVINVLVGAGIITLPSVLAQEVGQSSWLVLSCGLILAIIGIWLVTKLNLLFPQDSIALYSRKILGKYLAFFFNMALTGYFIFITGLVIRSFSDSVNILALARTPLEVTMASMLIVAAVLARNGLQAIVRAAQIIFFLFFVPFTIIPFFWQQFDWGNFLPIWEGGIEEFTGGLLASLFAIAGFEVLLVIGPKVENKQKVTPSGILGILLVGTLYLFTTIISIGTLSAPQTAKVLDPIFEVVKYTPVPILLLERLDLLFFSLWIAAVYTTIVIFLYATSRHLADTISLKQGKELVWPVILIVLYIARIPQNVYEVDDYLFYIQIIWLVIVYGIIPLMLLIGLLKQFIGRSNKKTKSRR